MNASLRWPEDLLDPPLSPSVEDRVPRQADPGRQPPRPSLRRWSSLALVAGILAGTAAMFAQAGPKQRSTPPTGTAVTPAAQPIEASTGPDVDGETKRNALHYRGSLTGTRVPDSSAVNNPGRVLAGMGGSIRSIRTRSGQ